MTPPLDANPPAIPALNRPGGGSGGGPVTPSRTGEAAATAREESWTRWLMQTARRWDDISDVIRMTGIERVDTDHRNMTEVVLEINNLIDLFDADGPQLASIQEEERTLERLALFARGHFRREMAIIEKFGLPGAELQRQQHAAFLAMLDGFRRDFQEGRLTVFLNLKNSVLEWWIRHINEVDHATFNLSNWTERAIQAAHTWDDVAELIKSTGVASIDRQHRQMTELTLKLVHLVEEERLVPQLTPEDRARAAEAFEALLTCAAEHFAHEESFIAHFGLEGLERQRQQHVQFLEQLGHFRDQVGRGELAVSRELQTAILGWWVQHINDEDFNLLSLEKCAHAILGKAASWEEATEYIGKTGVAEVDEDHRHITEYLITIDQLIRSFAGESPPADLHRDGEHFFTALRGLCQDHFTHEEGLMARASYLGLRVHKEQHDRFLTMLDRYREDFVAGRVVASLAMKRYILHWWVTHIREYDLRAFASSLPREGDGGA